MHTGPLVVRGVVAEVAREVVEEWVDAVHTRIILIRRVEAGVVPVCNPGRMDERKKTGKQYHQHGIRWVEVERETDDRPERDFHPQECTQIFRIAEADSNNVDLVMKQQVDRIFDPAHL